MIFWLKRLLKLLARPLPGQTLVDYGGVLVFVSIAGISMLVLTGTNLTALYNTWIAAVLAALSGAP